MSIVTVTALFANEEEARTIGRIVVEERLAACANIGGVVESIYHWQSEIAQASEVAAAFKTTAAMADALIARIAELHSYEVPCVYSAPIDQLLASYGDWVEENVRR
jgi:periplasmic divalent cation tolerance protein